LIKIESFGRDWILAVKAQIRSADPQTIEKLLRAYYLCEQLTQSGLDFTFKGGTCLTLLTKQPRRFSTDIDIVTQVERKELETKLQTVCKTGQFTEFELDERRSYNPSIPKAHYAMKYTSVIDHRDNDIQLDILFTDSLYSEIQNTPIVSEYLKLEGNPSQVRTPTLAALMGDKLTAFAPTTVGVPYGTDKEREIIKQLYDLGIMFDLTPPFDVVVKTYNAFVEEELFFRPKLNANREDVLKDTLKACEVITRRTSQLSAEDEAHFSEIETGLRGFRQFPIKESFRIEEAIAASSKVAFIAAKLLKADNSPILTPPSNLQRNDWLIPSENRNYNFLNRRLRGVDPQAQFYWYKTLQLLGEL